MCLEKSDKCLNLPFFTCRDLKKAGFECLDDVLHFFPRTYINYGADEFLPVESSFVAGTCTSSLTMSFSLRLVGRHTEESEGTWNAGTVLRQDAFVRLDGIVTKLSASAAKHLVFTELTAEVETAAVLPSPGELPGSWSCLQHGPKKMLCHVQRLLLCTADSS